MSLIEDIRGASGAAVGAVSEYFSTDHEDGGDRDVPFEQMSKALEHASLAEPTEEKPRGLFHDPYSVMDWGGWRQRPSVLTYDTLRQMTVSNTVIAAIIQTRINQVAQFALPQQGQYDKGYRVILRDRRDSNKAMSKQEEKKAQELERMLETTGYLLPEERTYDRDTFRQFLKKAVRDCLTYDQICFEKIRDRKGRVSRFVCLPSETIRPAVADLEHMDPEERRDRVAYVQVYEDSVIAEFGPDDMAWCVMNPRSDLRVNGFGFSPIEQVTRLVTAWLYGFEYNTKFFSQGSAIKGLLNVKGSIPDRQLRAFRRMWYSQLSGVTNSWKTPILNAEDLQWVNMHSTNREMEYGAWMDWVTKLICAVFGIDPVEINFIFGGSGGESSMFSSRPNQAEVVESKDKGLRPLINHLQDCINHHIIWELEPEFEFAFTGMDAKAEEKEREARMTEVTKIKTVNEIRAEMDMPPMPDELGDVILDPNYTQWVQMKEAPEEDGFGDEDDEDGGGFGGFGGGDDDDKGGDDKPKSGNDKKEDEPKEQKADRPTGKAEKPSGQKEALAASMDVLRTIEVLRKSHKLHRGQQAIDIEIAGG
jgi:HK97 family phage portal protein